jgi:plastocyanin
VRIELGRLAAAAWLTAAGLAGCYDSTSNRVLAVASSSPIPPPTMTPTPKPTRTPPPTPTPSGPTPTPTAQPQVVHIAFAFGETTDPTYGPVYFYSPNGKSAAVVKVKSGSQLVFQNDESGSTQHTASGLGTKFPPSFDNSSGFTQSGTTIDGGTTWSTGTLNPGQLSQVFTIGPPGVYYFGCAFHYFQPPNASNGSMGDVLVSE